MCVRVCVLRARGEVVWLKTSFVEKMGRKKIKIKADDDAAQTTHELMKIKKGGVKGYSAKHTRVHPTEISR